LLIIQQLTYLCHFNKSTQNLTFAFYYTHTDLMRPFRLAFLLLVLLLSLPSFQLMGQERSVAVQTLDDQLINGKIYSYYPPKSVVGNQFLTSSEFIKGVVWISGKEYRDVLINYDILNQKLLISFKNLQGANVIIAQSMAYVEYFYLDDKKFIVKRDSKDRTNIYQLIQVGEAKFFIRWHKILDLRTSLNIVQYEFSKPLRTLYYQTPGGKQVLIKSNSSFYKQFPKKKAVQIKKYMRSNKLKITKLNFSQYMDLLNFTEMLGDA